MLKSTLFALAAFAFSPALAAAMRPAPAAALHLPVIVYGGSPDVLLIAGLM
ncbi:MAG: hypothetical protein QOH81_2068 [Sphingomonadales bacterium]|jgi:hypothetical protein|nr:hypothetical protein [Sphingomonadales bacterium]